MTLPPTVNCRVCGRAFERKQMGRHPAFCSRSCREMAAFARKYYRRYGPEGRGALVTHSAA